MDIILQFQHIFGLKHGRDGQNVLGSEAGDRTYDPIRNPRKKESFRTFCLLDEATNGIGRFFCGCNMAFHARLVNFFVVQ